MSDSVLTSVLLDNDQRVVVHLTNISDGTGETNVIKVDKSAYPFYDGTSNYRLVLEKIDYCVPMFRVVLSYDSDTDIPLLVLQGNDHLCFDDVNGLDLWDGTQTGDILVSTVNQAAEEGYTLVLYFKKERIT